jgi:hypothetical protein
MHSSSLQSAARERRFARRGPAGGHAVARPPSIAATRPHSRPNAVAATSRRACLPLVCAGKPPSPPASRRLRPLPAGAGRSTDCCSATKASGSAIPLGLLRWTRHGSAAHFTGAYALPVHASRPRGRCWPSTRVLPSRDLDSPAVAGRRRPPGVDDCAHARRSPRHAAPLIRAISQCILALARPRCAAVCRPCTTHNREVGGSNPPGASART